MKRKSGQKNDIYIDCQPVNQDGDALVNFDVVQRGLTGIATEKSGDKLDVSSFAKGNYIITLKHLDKITAIRFVVQ